MRYIIVGAGAVGGAIGGRPAETGHDVRSGGAVAFLQDRCQWLVLAWGV